MTPAHRRIGYARVSTADQSLALQMDALKSAGCSHVFKEKASATRSQLPVLSTCLDTLETGDVLVVWKLDRFGRSLRELIARMQELADRGIGFQSLREDLDTTTPAGKLFFHFVAAMTEFEADLISERTKAGLAAARSRGNYPGRPKKLTPERMQLAEELLAKCDADNLPLHSVSEVARLIGLSPSTLYRALKAPSESSSTQ